MLVSFLGFCALPGDPGGEGAPTSTRCRLWFGCCAAGRGLVPYCGVRVGKPSVKQLCNPLDADQGAPHSRRGPADWLDAGTRDRHVAVLAQPAWVSLETEWRCCWARKWGRCWSYDGPACCGAGGEGEAILPRTVWNRWPFLGTGSIATCQARRQGRLPPPPLLQHRRWISCASDPGFLTEEEEGGRVGLKGSLVRKSCFWSYKEVLFL